MLCQSQSQLKSQVARLQSLVSTNFVPIADSYDLEDRPFVAVVREAKAVAQLTNSY